MFRRSMPLAFAVFMVLCVAACSGEAPLVDVAKLTSQPKAYVGSETCKGCHLEHYDSWKMTMHSRMAQDARVNEDVFVVDWDRERIRQDFVTIQDKLKIPAADVFIPEQKDILYTLGGQWKQRYIFQKDGEMYISPVQYNVETDRFVNYHEHDWMKRPWLVKCGGCHATGVDLENKTLVEPGVGCESCHGPGSHHAALPKTQIFDKRSTIINPSKLTPGVAVQICGSCHNRGTSTKFKGAGWPVGYMPGKALSAYYASTSFAAGDTKHVYANEFSKGHHQQYIDWVQSKHYKEGVTCSSCHYVHQLGMASNRSQTRSSGSKQCLTCHEVVNNNAAHAIHSFANCVGCHMPRIAKSAESGDIHSHVFMTLLPKDTLANSNVPNSCQTCHKHKNDDLKKLQERFDILSSLPKPVGKPTGRVSMTY